MFDIIVAYLPELNHYDIDGEGWRGGDGGMGVVWSNIFHYVDLINILDSSTPPQ